MATAALRRPAALERSMPGARALGLAGLVALVALSLALRVGELHVRFWIDEALSVGISAHPLGDLPHVLREDGSPPLYYVLLHFWMAVFGRSEAQTHLFSLVCALLAIPAAWWAGRSLFDARTGWALAGLTAINPFLTSYAQETRMYALVIVLGTLCTACFLHAYVFGRRAYRIPFGLALAALLYTHNWAFFYALGLLAVVALAWGAGEDRPRLLRDVAVGFGVAAVLYLPWVPTLVFQSLHTGAPWASAPSLTSLVKAPNMLLGGQSGTFVVLLAAPLGLATLVRGARGGRRVVVPALVVLAVVPIGAAWLLSQASPAWATRYLAIALPPMLLLTAVGLVRARQAGMVGLVLLAASWGFAGAPSAKSNVQSVAASMGARMRPGDVVVSTQPEQLPVLAYYMSPRLTYATPFGVTRDPGVTDWRDGAAHFDRTSYRTQLAPLVDRLRPGHHVLLVVPIVSKPENWQDPWGSRVLDRSLEYEGLLRGDPRLRVQTAVPTQSADPGPNPVLGILFVKTSG